MIIPTQNLDIKNNNAEYSKARSDINSPANLTGEATYVSAPFGANRDNIQLGNSGQPGMWNENTGMINPTQPGQVYNPGKGEPKFQPMPILSPNPSPNDPRLTPPFYDIGKGEPKFQPMPIRSPNPGFGDPQPTPGIYDVSKFTKQPQYGYEPWSGYPGGYDAWINRPIDGKYNISRDITQPKLGVPMVSDPNINGGIPFPNYQYSYPEQPTNQPNFGSPNMSKGMPGNTTPPLNNDTNDWHNNYQAWINNGFNGDINAFLAWRNVKATDNMPIIGGQPHIGKISQEEQLVLDRNKAQLNVDWQRNQAQKRYQDDFLRKQQINGQYTTGTPSQNPIFVAFDRELAKILGQ